MDYFAMHFKACNENLIRANEKIIHTMSMQETRIRELGAECEMLKNEIFRLCDIIDALRREQSRPPFSDEPVSLQRP